MAAALDTSHDRTRKYRATQRQNGGAQIGVVLKPGDEATMWNRLVFEQGGPTPALRYLLRLAMGRADQPLTNEALARLVAARLASAPEPETIRPQPKSARKKPGKSG